MAFVEDDIPVLSEIVEMTPEELTSWLDAYGSRISDASEDRVREYMEQWPSVANGNVINLLPTESNFGTRFQGGLSASNITNRVRKLLEMPALNNGSWTKLRRA